MSEKITPRYVVMRAGEVNDLLRRGYTALTRVLTLQPILAKAELKRRGLYKTHVTIQSQLDALLQRGEFWIQNPIGHLGRELWVKEGFFVSTEGKLVYRAGCKDQVYRRKDGGIESIKWQDGSEMTQAQSRISATLAQHCIFEDETGVLKWGMLIRATQIQQVA